MKNKQYYWFEFFKNSNILNITPLEYNYWILTENKSYYYDKDLGKSNKKNKLN